MKTWVRRTARVGILSAGFLLLASSAANAADLTAVSAGNDGVANGTQVVVPVQIPVDVAGVGVGVLGLGNGNAGIAGASAVNEDYTTTSNGGAIGAGVLGMGDGTHGASLGTESARTTESADDTLVSADNDGLLNGTQAYVPVQVPVNVCGIGVGVLGLGNGNAGICGSAAVRDGGDHGRESATESARTTESADDTLASVDNDGVLNGTQVYVPIQVPVNVSGVGVGVLGIGNGNAGVAGSAAVRDGGRESARTTESADDTLVSSDNDGVLNGTQVYAPIQVPVNVCGIGVGVLGLGNGNAGACGSAAVRDGGDHGRDGGWHHGRSHDHGGYNWDHVTATPMAAKTGTEGAEATVAPRPADRHHGSSDLTAVSAGNKGVLNGTQVIVPIQIPVNVSGIGVGVLGIGNGNAGIAGAGAVR